MFAKKKDSVLPSRARHAISGHLSSHRRTGEGNDESEDYAIPLFAKGFYQFLITGEHSDVTLICKKKKYKVHRLILSHSSEYFYTLLSSDFKEANQTVINLHFDDEEDVFPSLLEYMYLGKPNLNDTNAIPLLAMADHYLMAHLKKLCNEYLSSRLTKDSALHMLRSAISYGCEDIIKRCILILAKIFSQQTDHDYNFMPPEIFTMFLQHRYLAVKSEYILYTVVNSYINAHKESLTPEEIQTFMDSVRFRWLTYSQLEETILNPYVPRDLIVEALMAVLKDQLNGVPDMKGSRDASYLPTRLQPRLSYGISFEFLKDWDLSGIFFWIGTTHGRTSWRNPIHNKVAVTASSIERGNPKNLLSIESSELWTQDVPASWFQIDLGENRSVFPTYYTLRHGGNYRADSLRTWDFQGSRDGKEWVLLYRHTNDDSLNDLFALKTWPIKLTEPAVFRFFRILQTGHNSSNHNFLVLSGIEIYGDYYEGNVDEINDSLSDSGDL